MKESFGQWMFISVISAYLLTFLNSDFIFCKAIQELFDLKVTNASYYVLFMIISAIIGVFIVSLNIKSDIGMGDAREYFLNWMFWGIISSWTLTFFKADQITCSAAKELLKIEISTYSYYFLYIMLTIVFGLIITFIKFNNKRVF